MRYFSWGGIVDTVLGFFGGQNYQDVEAELWKGPMRTIDSYSHRD